MEKAKGEPISISNPEDSNKTQFQVLPLPRSKPSNRNSVLKRRFPKESRGSVLRQYGRMNGAAFTRFNDAMKYCNFFAIKNFIDWQNMSIYLSSNMYRASPVAQGIDSLLFFIGRKLKRLKSFGFSSQTMGLNCKLPKMVRTITTLVCSNLVNLNELYLGFDWKEEEVDKGTMIFLGHEITRYLPNLRKLGLSISNNKSITDEGIEALTLKITQGLPKLTNLTLCFSSSNISDKGLVTLVSLTSKHLCRLHILRLNFLSCQNITDHGLNAISSKIILLVHLQDLSLDFLWCNITDPALDHLKAEINKHLKKMKRFDLNKYERMNPHIKRPNQKP